MKTLALIAGLAFLATSPVYAASLQMSWTGDVKAKTYRIEYSLDIGEGWVIAKGDIPQPFPFPSNGMVSAIVTVPDAGLVLLRAVAIGANETAIRYESGAWYNAKWEPMGVGKLGIE